MSDYNNSFNGAGKDAGNDIIYGVDLDTQFDNIATMSATKSNKVVPSSANNVAYLSVSGDLVDAGFSFPNVNANITATDEELNLLDGVTITTQQINEAAFPAGTKMLFQQTAAPTGWTKDTTHDDKALRVVSGTASNGGSIAFSTALGASAVTDNHTLLKAEVPATDISIGVNNNGAVDGGTPIYSVTNVDGPATISNDGGGGAHAHGLPEIQYVDIIICTKD